MKMRAIVASRFDPDFDGLSVATVERPPAEAGELLIKVRCAPVNPADRMMVAGTYIRGTQVPFIPGVVGVGDAVAAGSGFMPRLLIGKRVVFAATKGKGGSWAEYAVAPASLCLPLPANMSDEAGVNLLANAATAVALAQRLSADGHKAAIMTGAAGELASLVKEGFARRDGTLIGVVRGKQHVTRLKAQGWTVVLDGDDAAADAELAAAVRATGATAAIDTIAGPMTERLMEALPDRSLILSVGRLSSEKTNFDPMRQLIGRGMRLEGFTIDDWFAARSLPGQLAAVRRAIGLLQDNPVAPPRAILSLDEAVAHLPNLITQGGQGKILISSGKSQS